MSGRHKPAGMEQAEAWLDEHTMPAGDRPRGLEDAGAEPTIDELRIQQRREARHLGLGTEGQTMGAVWGSLIGAALGLLVGAAAGWAFLSAGAAARILIAIVVAIAGAVVGFVYWGGRTPELRNETMTATGGPGDGSTPRDPTTDQRGR